MVDADQGGRIASILVKGESAAIGLGGRTFLLVMHRRQGGTLMSQLQLRSEVVAEVESSSSRGTLK